MSWDLGASCEVPHCHQLPGHPGKHDQPELAPSEALELNLSERVRLVCAPGHPRLPDAAVLVCEDDEGRTVARLDRDQLALLRDWAALRLAAL